MNVRCLAIGLWLASSMLGFAAAQRPNIVLIISDDQGYGDLSLHGNTKKKTGYHTSDGWN